MSFDIPPNIEPQIQKFADALHISANEALVRLIQAGLEFEQVSSAETSRPTYHSFFGAAKGGYGSVEAVDEAIKQLRDEW